MKLSIIVPVFNVEKHLRKCLDSLLDQDINKSEYEILIINDGSTDGSLDIAEEYVARFSNIMVHTKENGGVGSARNNGLDRSKGDYVYFIDPDDYLKPNVLRLLLDTIISYNLEILTFSWTSFFDGKSKKITHEPAVKGDECVPLSQIMTGIDYIAEHKYKSSVWWYFAKRSFLVKSKVRFIEGRWMEDAIFTTQLFLKANTIADFPLNAHRYRVAPGTAMTSKKPSHYKKLIGDIHNAIFVFDEIVNDLKIEKVNHACIERIKTRQQAFVFFLLVRMIKSTMNFDEVRLKIGSIGSIGAYPLNSFIGEDYNLFVYQVIAPLLNTKSRFYTCFRLFNPFFKLRYKLAKNID